MNKKILMKGNEVIAEAAIQAGCRFYAGYPITPQKEIPEYMSWRMPEVGGVFIQAESELSAINMVYGSSVAGVRAMTSSSSPGMSLKQETISYMAGAEIPGVIVNVQRGGPGGTSPAVRETIFKLLRVVATATTDSSFMHLITSRRCGTLQCLHLTRQMNTETP